MQSTDNPTSAAEPADRACYWWAMTITRICPLLCLLFVGCATSPPATPHSDVTAKYTLQPGDEKYFCYTINLPADRDIAITKMTPTYGVGTHHILFAQTITPRPMASPSAPC